AQDIGEKPAALRVDGGATANDYLMQFQSDIAGVAIQRPAVLETTALGAALLAGLAVGVYPDLPATAAGWHVEKKFVPAMDADRRAQLLHGWERAVKAVLYWAKDE
ncbi:MAG: glycerol kinase, partial [Clostridia bacterium]|nr:glycerol kinase [Clostridia bacterium]